MTEHAQRAHSLLGASSAYRWMNCPGSFALCATLPPSPDSAASRDGTFAHEWCEYALNQRFRDVLRFVGTPLSARVAEKALTKEMADAVNVYANYVLDFAELPGAELSVEAKVNLSDIDADLWGTNDATVFDAFSATLHVFDFKYGFGYVDEKNNPQLQFYGYGAYLRHAGEVETVVIHIVQPRAHGEPIRYQKMHVSELVDWSFTLEDAVKAAKAPGAKCVSGQWCDKSFCTAKAVCPALRQDFDFLPVIDLENKGANYDVPNAELDDLAQYMRRFDGAEAFMKAVRERCEAEAFAGNMPKGFKLVQGAGRRVWDKKDGDESAIARTIGEFTDPWKKSLIGITDAEKAIGKKKFAEIAADLVTKKLPRPVLVPESDKRPAWTGDAGDDFNAVSTEGFAE